MIYSTKLTNTAEFRETKAYVVSRGQLNVLILHIRWYVPLRFLYEQ